MNILPPVLSTVFTKSFNNIIDRNSGMLYNNNVGDSFTFGQHSGPRSRRYREERINRRKQRELPMIDNINSKKNKPTEKTFFNDLIGLCEKAVDTDNNPLECLKEISALFKNTPPEIRMLSVKTDSERNFYNNILSYYLDTPKNLSSEKYRSDINYYLADFYGYN